MTSNSSPTPGVKLEDCSNYVKLTLNPKFRLIKYYRSLPWQNNPNFAARRSSLLKSFKFGTESNQRDFKFLPIFWKVNRTLELDLNPMQTIIILFLFFFEKWKNVIVLVTYIPSFPHICKKCCFGISIKKKNTM